jgi:hypothetical protein
MEVYRMSNIKDLWIARREAYHVVYVADRHAPPISFHLVDIGRAFLVCLPSGSLLSIHKAEVGHVTDIEEATVHSNGQFKAWGLDPRLVLEIFNSCRTILEGKVL